MINKIIVLKDPVVIYFCAGFFVMELKAQLDRIKDKLLKATG